MRIATFNLESFGGERFDAADLAPRIEALRPELLALEADILCLQEVNAQHVAGTDRRSFPALEALLEDTPYAHYFRVSSERAIGYGPADRHNLLVLSRYPLKPASSIWHARVEAPLWRPRHADPPIAKAEGVSFDRPVLQTAAELPDGRWLHLFTVHLRAPIAAAIPGAKESAGRWKDVPGWAEGLFLAAMKRSAQALELRLALEEIFDREAEPLVLVAGDFNAGEVEAALRIIAADPQETGNPDLAARAMRVLDHGLAAVDRYSVIHRGRGRMLDHILASAALAASFASIRVFNAELEDEAEAKGDPPGSFHAAVAADFNPG